MKPLSKTQLDVLRKMAGGTLMRHILGGSGYFNGGEKMVKRTTVSARLNAKFVAAHDGRMGISYYVITPAGRAAVEGEKAK